MKRIFSCFLLIWVLITATACIRLETPPNDGAETTHREPEATEPDSGIAPPTPPSHPWENAEKAADYFFTSAKTIVDSSRAEYSYSEMESDLKALQNTYAHLFSYRSFGKSLDGRELYVATLGNPDAETCIFITAGIHGREYLTPLLAMKQMEFFLAYGNMGDCNGISYQRLLEEFCFYVVPMINPDGIMISQEGISSVRDPELQKTVEEIYRLDLEKEYTSQTDIDNYLQYWKANARGVDLNRNFDALWEDYKLGEREPCHKSYKGPEPASEPETKALVSLTQSLPTKPVAVLCIHSQGEVLYWNCGQTEPLAQATRDLTAELAKRSGYELIEKQNNDASFSDWCALNQGMVAITIETGKGLCPLFIDKFEAIWFDYYDLLPLTAKYFLH